MSRGAIVLMVLLGIGAIALMILVQPSPLDTRVRLEREGDAPFDAEVFYAALPDWLGAPVTPVADPIYTRLEDSTITGTTYVVLTRAFAPGEEEAERMLDFVARGNTVLVAAHALAGPFFQALGDTTDGRPGLAATFADDLPFIGQNALYRRDSLVLHTPGVRGGYAFPVEVELSTLSGFDTTKTELLGTAGFSDDATLVRVRHGRGAVVVSSTPLAFSNAALTGEGDAPAYLAGLLAAVPSQPVLWDDYSKPYKSVARTPLRYVLTTPALRWAYWIGLALIVLLVVFRGRRWQRAIPLVAPPPNAQREFARTVGRLHFVHGDTARLLAAKRRVFLDRLRTRLRLPDPQMDEETARRAARRAGVPEDEARDLFSTFARLAGQGQPAGADLVDLDNRLAAFFRHVDARGDSLAPEGPGDGAEGAASGEPVPAQAGSAATAPPTPA